MNRLNIALLISELEDPFGEAVCEGANSAAKEIDANLFVFPGKYLDGDYNEVYSSGYDYQFNCLFDYAKYNDIDVFVICMGTIASNIPEEKRLEFLMQFPKPVVILASKTEGFPNVYFDNKTGLKQGIRHLIEEHGRKNIGFVSGPSTSEDARERLLAYKEVLKECGIPYNEDYVVYGNFTKYTEDLVRGLMQKNPKLDAVVFANDLSAVGGYTVFKEMGLDIGEDISVLGFDDSTFAMTMEPRLSSVKADPMELSYQAIINIEEILAGNINEIVIPSVSVSRASCGCRGKQIAGGIIDIDNMFMTGKEEDVLESMFEYLLGRNARVEGSAVIKKRVTEFYRFMISCVLAPNVSEKEFTQMFHMMKNLLYMELEPYTNLAKLSHLFGSIYKFVGEKLASDEQRQLLSDTYYMVYADVVAYQNKLAVSKESEADFLNFIATGFIRDIMNFSIGDDRAYYSILEKLKSLHYISAYLCLFEEKVIHKKNEPYHVPEYILLKTYMDRGDMGWLEAGEQKTKFENLITDLYCERQQRVTVIITALYSTIEQYGIFISEIEDGYLHNSVPIGYQMNAAVKTIELLKENSSMLEHLKKNIDEIKEKNMILDEISKSDELTQIYNRRGFLTMVQRRIQHSANQGKKALVIYADMNNLKIINDRFGHEEGDYSLKLIAEILKETFDKDSIIGRFGGDEFVAFSFAKEEKTARIIRQKINEVTKKKNEKNGKPYYVSMSVGVCEFECDAGISLKDLMDKADVDLYIEKKHKRSNVLKNENEAI